MWSFLQSDIHCSTSAHTPRPMTFPYLVQLPVRYIKVSEAEASPHMTLVDNFPFATHGISSCWLGRRRWGRTPEGAPSLGYSGLGKCPHLDLERRKYRPRLLKWCYCGVIDRVCCGCYWTCEMPWWTSGQRMKRFRLWVRGS